MATKIEPLAWVILRKDKCMKLVQIRPKQKEYIAKVQFSFDGAIGHHFGTSFDIVKGQLVKMDPKMLESVVGNVGCKRWIVLCANETISTEVDRRQGCLIHQSVV